MRLKNAGTKKKSADEAEAVTKEKVLDIGNEVDELNNLITVHGFGKLTPEQLEKYVASGAIKRIEPMKTSKSIVPEKVFYMAAR